MKSFNASWNPAPFRAAQPRLGQEGAPISGAQIKRAGVGLGLAVTTLSAAAAWVGIRTGIRDSGLVSVAGWVVGLAGAITGAMTFFGTASLLFTASDELDRVAQEAQQSAPVSASAKMPILETM